MNQLLLVNHKTILICSQSFEPPPELRCKLDSVWTLQVCTSSYVSNILVLREYYILFKRHMFAGDKEHLSSGSFYVCLGFMSCDPVVATEAFKLKLPRDEHPLWSAIFLPVVQFQRFVAGIFKTGSCAR